MGNSPSAPKATAYTQMAEAHREQTHEYLPSSNLRSLESELKEMRKPALLSKAEAVGVDAGLIDECSHEAGKDRLIAAILDRYGRPPDIFGERENDMPFFIKMLPPVLQRANSVDVTNDPRNFEYSTLDKRYSAFDSIVMGATLMASLACTVCIEVLLTQRQRTWAFIGAYASLILAFVFNLFCVTVITQQKYQIMRLATSGPHGFEISKSYYLNATITKLRHVSVKGFTLSLPLFLFAVGLVIFDFSFAYAPYLASICLGVISLIALVLFATVHHQRVTFRHYYATAKKFSQPLRQHMHDVNRRNNDGNLLYN